jgi:hypothetical protein
MTQLLLTWPAESRRGHCASLYEWLGLSPSLVACLAAAGRPRVFGFDKVTFPKFTAWPAWPVTQAETQVLAAVTAVTTKVGQLMGLDRATADSFTGVAVAEARRDQFVILDSFMRVQPMANYADKFVTCLHGVRAKWLAQAVGLARVTIKRKARFSLGFDMVYEQVQAPVVRRAWRGHREHAQWEWAWKVEGTGATTCDEALAKAKRLRTLLRACGFVDVACYSHGYESFVCVKKPGRHVGPPRLGGLKR